MFIPPPSPTPGWDSGDVWREITARLRTGISSTSSSATAPTQSSSVDLGFGARPGILPSGRKTPGRVGRRGARLGAALEGVVDLDEDLLLALGDRRVAQDLGHDVGVAVPGLEDSGPHVERLSRDAQRPGDRLENFGAGLAQAPFDLAQVGVRNPRQLREL